jgi:hypothetical protein
VTGVNFNQVLSVMANKPERVQESTMEDEVFNPTGMNINRLMDIIQSDFIPDDDKIYVATIKNLPKNRYVTVSIEQVPEDTTLPISMVTNMNIGHATMSVDAGAFCLQRQWTCEITYHQGEKNA